MFKNDCFRRLIIRTNSLEALDKHSKKIFLSLKWLQGTLIGENKIDKMDR